MARNVFSEDLQKLRGALAKQFTFEYLWFFVSLFVALPLSGIYLEGRVLQWMVGVGGMCGLYVPYLIWSERRRGELIKKIRSILGPDQFLVIVPGFKGTTWVALFMEGDYKLSQLRHDQMKKRRGRKIEILGTTGRAAPNNAPSP